MDCFKGKLQNKKTFEVYYACSHCQMHYVCVCCFAIAAECKKSLLNLLNLFTDES